MSWLRQSRQLSIELPSLIAEYLSLASSLRKGEGSAAYRRANHLSFLLAITMPANEYKEMVKTIMSPTIGETLRFIAAYRNKHDLIRPKNNHDWLAAFDIAYHAPGIGEINPDNKEHPP